MEGITALGHWDQGQALTRRSTHSWHKDKEVEDEAASHQVLEQTYIRRDVFYRFSCTPILHSRIRTLAA